MKSNLKLVVDNTRNIPYESKVNVLFSLNTLHAHILKELHLVQEQMRDLSNEILLSNENNIPEELVEALKAWSKE